jgi:hypothetical protein
MVNKNKAQKSSKKKVNEDVHEPVTNCNQSEEMVANSSQSEAAKPSGDHLEKCEISLSQQDIESLIRTIRGQKVMVDFDLAMLYGVKNKRLNEQVKRNIKRFPSDFMFQLTKEEWNTLRSQIATAQPPGNQDGNILKSQIATSSWGGTRKLPYAFTRNGIGMLSSVLGSDTAVEMNIRIMRVFTAAHQIMENNAILFKKVLHLEQHQIETDEKIDHLITKMNENSSKLLPEQIFQTGCVWDAWSYVSDLVRSAKQRIVLIDNFVDDRVLSLFSKRDEGVKATIYSRYNEQFQIDLKKHNEQYPAIDFIQLPHRNHDRFLIIDNNVYFMGASLKDMGAGLCAVTEMQVDPDTLLQYLI